MENIRFLESNNEKWYVLRDICDLLGLKRTNSSKLNISEKYIKMLKINTKGGKQNMVTTNIIGIKQILHSSRSIHKDKIITHLNIDLNVVFDYKETSWLKIISTSFNKFKQNFQYYVDGYRIDLYFPEYNLAIEVDEFNHKDRDKMYEIKREKYIKEKLSCKFIRFNPDEKNFNIGEVISNILENTLEQNMKLLISRHDELENKYLELQNA